MLKFNAPAALTVPAPVTSPRAGTTASMALALSPAGLAVTLDVNFWMVVSGLL